MKNEKRSVFSNFIWRFAERCGAQLVGFVVSVVLARILNPTDYGTVALITVFTAVLQVFVDSGLGNALIQKKDADDIDFSTVFYTNIVFCAVLYLGVFLCAPVISGFYNDVSMTPMIRVLALTVMISGVKNVQQAYVSRHLIFKKFFFATLAGTVGAAVLGIFLAYQGFGAWALVAQQVFNLTVDTLVLWVTVKWRPKRVFSWQRLKTLYSFGWKLLVSSLLDRGYTELRQLIIGKTYSSADLAFYERGRQFPNLIVTNINTSIDSVLLPVMSNAQESREQVKAMTRRSIRVSTYIMAPLMIGLACAAEPVVRLILTEKWLPCVPFLQVFCFTFMFYPIHTANLNAIKAMGRSDLFLKMEIAKKGVGLAALFITMNISVMAMAYSLLVTTVISQIINSWPNAKLLGYRYIDQLKDILPNVLMAAFMSGCVMFIDRLGFSDIITLLIQVVLGAIIYIVCSKIFKNESFDYLMEVIKPFLKRKNKKVG